MWRDPRSPPGRFERKLAELIDNSKTVLAGIGWSMWRGPRSRQGCFESRLAKLIDNFKSALAKVSKVSNGVRTLERWSPRARSEKLLHVAYPTKTDVTQDHPPKADTCQHSLQFRSDFVVYEIAQASGMSVVSHDDLAILDRFRNGKDKK